MFLFAPALKARFRNFMVFVNVAFPKARYVSSHWCAFNFTHVSSPLAQEQLTAAHRRKESRP